MSPFRFILKLNVSVVVILLFFSFTQITFAQSIPSNQSSQQNLITQNLSSSPHGASKAIYDFYHASSCILIGQSPIDSCLEYKLYKDIQGNLKSLPVLNSTKTDQGVLGMGISLLTGIYDTRPLSSSEFLAQAGSEIGLVKKAHAQVGGSGNSILSSVYKLWEVSRNIAYLTMIVIFLTVGVMVMFRQKLNPQTVVTVQLALPGLVIGLVMITFSYFLASLLTDLAFIGTDLVGYYFQAAQVKANPNPSLLTTIGNENSLGIMSRMTSAVGDFDISSGIASVMDNLSGRAGLYVNTFIAYLAYQYGGQLAQGVLTPIGAIVGVGMGGLPGASAGATIGTIVGTVAGGLLGSGVTKITPGLAFNYIISFILVAMMILTIFRLILKLINNFLAIIFYTIFSPFTFLMASLPGKQGIISDWIKNMLCNVLAFPGVLGVLYFSYYLLTGGQPLLPDTASFIIPDIKSISLAGNSAPPLMGGLDLKLINVLLAFGAFIATPSVPDIICKTIGKIGPAFGIIENQISGSQRSAQGYVNQAAGAPGKISKDVGQLGQFGGQKSWTYDPFGKTMVHAKGPGLWTQLTGR